MTSVSPDVENGANTLCFRFLLIHLPSFLLFLFFQVRFHDTIQRPSSPLPRKVGPKPSVFHNRKHSKSAFQIKPPIFRSQAPASRRRMRVNSASRRRCVSVFTSTTLLVEYLIRSQGHISRTDCNSDILHCGSMYLTTL